MIRQFTAYFVATVVTIALIVAILHFGRNLRPAADERSAAQPAAAAASNNAPASPYDAMRERLRSPTSVLLLQVIVIALAARLLGRAFERMGQPPVIGEIVAGILLGPSLLGWLAPSAMAFLFPPDSMGVLKLLAELGVILFMFVVGMELNAEHLRRHAGAAVIVSHVSILLPFLLGVAFALAIYRPMAPAGVGFTPFALFMGVGMSITAFPVLARIIEERGLSNTMVGTTAIACAAVDDVTAWCMLALVIAVVKAQSLAGTMLTVAMAMLFAGAMLMPIRWMFARAGARLDPLRPNLSKLTLTTVLVFVLGSALATETIGIHSLFGAFLAGVAMPPHEAFRRGLRQRLETFASISLLPLFFAFTGLRTQIALVIDPSSLLIGLGVLAVAVTGKLVGSMLAARFTGMRWRDAFALGALMNTRGLVELIVLNIGYDLGVLSPRVFAMMVLMALVTTFLTGPLLGLARLTNEADKESSVLQAV